MRVEELGSYISDNQFILHIINNMMNDYDLQLAMTEKKVKDKSTLLIVNEICDDLNLRYERLTEKQNEEIEDGNNQEVVFFVANLKENFKILVQSGIKRITAMQNSAKMTIRRTETTNFFQKK
jgi:DNA-binding cell septation regulator SpoVG